MSNGQNGHKFFPRDEKGYYGVPDQQEKHCPTCAYSGKCYVDDVHSWPWTTSECVNAGYVHYRPRSSGYDSSIVKLHVCDDVIPKAMADEIGMRVTDQIVVRDMEHDELLEQVSKLTFQVERLKDENERLAKCRNCGEWIAIKHPYTNSHGTCEIEDEFHCPFCNVVSDSRTNFCSNCGSYLRGMMNE